MHFAFALPILALVAAVGGVPVVPVAPEVTSSQFHSQDEAAKWTEISHAFPHWLVTLPSATTTQWAIVRNLATLRLELSGDLTQMHGEGPSTMSLTNLDSGQLFESRSYQARPAQVSNKQLKHLQLCNWIFTPRVEQTFLVVYSLFRVLFQFFQAQQTYLMVIPQTNVTNKQ